ncbi:hypothetical protein CFB47_31140 [Burkholderia sp. AU27893]|uniref:Fimbrial protein n=2 Tax=Burkholderiaceae TaxID=119060 RepID=A0A2S5E3Y2_9BURK|nr:hypothetical protein CFB47_31140 [Burkholderia sp. AU27893]POZ86051.1 hypothetical protein C3743_05915 [Burkholderia contaminans]
MYHNYGGTGPWVTREPFIANFEVLISDEVVKDWPAVSLRAANFTGANNVAENTGGVYVSKDMTSGCKVIDPETPPPPDIGISMSAPDWNLGELPQGTQEKQMSNSADRLCFTYSGAAVGTKNFTIDAISQNGRDGTKFRLRNLADTTQIVPYDVKLEGAGTSLMLPNTGNVSLKFDGSGKTCFTPTFRTTVDKTLKPGDYSDVLTFTVVTKS